MNLGPTGYEPVALTTELWALNFEYRNILIKNQKGKCELLKKHPIFLKSYFDYLK